MAEAPEPNTDQTKMEEAQDVDKLTQQVKKLDVSGIENNKRIDTMWDTVLDHQDGYTKAKGLANKTYLVCKIDGGETIIKENTKEKHAEINFIEYLQTNSVAGKHLTVYINNSPCNDCAKALKKYLTENKDSKFTIYVTHLYNIRRKSCQLNTDNKKEDHMRYITETKHEATYDGLKKLLSLGKERCTINPFTKEVWEDLHKVMGLTEDYQNRITTYATTNTEKSHDRSRKNEDDNIRSDLIHLQANKDPWHEIQRNY